MIKKKVKKHFEKIKDLASIGVSNIAAMGISAIFFLYIASLIGEEGYGNLSYLFAIGNIVGNIALLGSSDVLVVYRAKNVKIQSTIFLIVVITSIISSIVTYVFIESIVVSLFILGMVIFTLTIHEAIGIKNFKKYSLYIISQRILGIILALILYFYIGLEGIILGYALGYLPFAIFGYRSCKNTPIDFQMFTTRKKFIANSYAKALMKTFSAQLDKIIIFPLSSKEINPNSNILSGFGAKSRPLYSSIFSLSLLSDQGLICAPINNFLFLTFVIAHSVGQSLKSFFLKKFCQADDLLLILTLDSVLEPVGEFML